MIICSHAYHNDRAALLLKLNSDESVYSRDCCHSQQGRLGFQEKTSNWEGDPPGELTVPQTDTGEQVEYTRALERTMSKELGKMTP